MYLLNKSENEKCILFSNTIKLHLGKRVTNLKIIWILNVLNSPQKYICNSIWLNKYSFLYLSNTWITLHTPFQLKEYPLSRVTTPRIDQEQNYPRFTIPNPPKSKPSFTRIDPAEANPHRLRYCPRFKERTPQFISTKKKGYSSGGKPLLYVLLSPLALLKIKVLKTVRILAMVTETIDQLGNNHQNSWI